MKTGISFWFDHKSGLGLGEDAMKAFLPEQFNKGQMQVLHGDKQLGVAGQLSADTIDAIPKGTDLSIVVELDQEQAVLFKTRIASMNDAIDKRNKVFTIVEPS